MEIDSKERFMREAIDFATPITNDTILYAKWEIVIYTVTLEYNNGSEAQTQSVESGQTAVKPADPTKDHFNFAGWCSDAECQTPFDFATPIVGDTNLYAKWSNLPVYIVAFDLNGGKYGSSDTYTQNIEDGSKAMRPASDPSKDDYVSGDVTTKYAFDNWYADAGCGTLFDFDATAISGATTVYAKWSETKYYAVKVASDAKRGSVSSDATEHVAAGTLVTLTATPNPGYEFVSYTVTDANSNPVTVADGKFEMPASPVTVTAAFAPVPLTLEAIEAGVKVTFRNRAAGPVKYRVNDGEKQIIESNTIEDITLEKVGDRISFYGDNTTYYDNTNYKSSNINCDKDCYIYGNIMSLVDSANYENAKELSKPAYLGISTFCNLFEGNSHIKNKSGEELILPATTLATTCYGDMFKGCTSLTSAPALPATTLAPYCYENMFKGCTSLTSAPALPATTLATTCYGHMFNGCTSLTSTPALPATTLAPYCYENMFNGCTSLTSAPALPATTLKGGCYKDMFNGCASLTSAPTLPATTLVDECYYEMFHKCASLKSITCLATDISAYKCIYFWLFSVKSTGTFIKSPTMTSWPDHTTQGIPIGWTVVDYQE